MKKPRKELSTMQLCRNLLHRVLEEHDAQEHPGEPCAQSRLSVIAFLAHSLGVQTKDFWKLAEYLLEYDANCPGNNCRSEHHLDGKG